MVKNRTLNELRKIMYQIKGYNPPTDELVYSDELIEQKQREQEQHKNVMDKLKKEYPSDAVEAFVKMSDAEREEYFEVNDRLKKLPLEYLRLQTAIGRIASMIASANKYATANNLHIVAKADLDKYILDTTEFDELGIVVDYVLAIAVNVAYKIDNTCTDFKKYVEMMEDLFSIGCDEILLQVAKQNNSLEVSVDRSLWEIDTSKLYVGLVVKNYTELCGLLGQEPKKGKSRQLQEEMFKRYFVYEKLKPKSHKLIIVDIFKEPIPKVDKRIYGNNSIYVKAIELILLQHLAKREGFTRTLTDRNLWEFLGMINENYKTIPNDVLNKKNRILTDFEINHFYQRNNKRLKRILYSALNNLKSRKLITYEIQTIIEPIKGKYINADDNDKKKILKAERYIMHDVMGYDNIHQIYWCFKDKEYFQKVQEYIRDFYGWKRYFKQVKIVYLQKEISEEVPQAEIELQREFLNKKMVELSNKEAQVNYEKVLEKYRQNQGSKLKLPATYIKAQELLVDNLIDLDAKKIDHRQAVKEIFEFISCENDDDLNFFDTFTE